ncbi:hypothetical protein C8J57DRAFT_1525345 [Mycena rebaudengoi]|nr:hypothetical protein C8J57DRAFT_1525345 [Mycena rebaudengoi]
MSPLGIRAQHSSDSSLHYHILSFMSFGLNAGKKSATGLPFWPQHQAAETTPDAPHLLELQYDCEHPSMRHPRVYVLLPPHHPDTPAHYAPADTLVPLRVFETVAPGGFTHTLSAADAAVIDAVASSVSSSRSPSLSYLSTPATSVSPSPPPKATILCETERFRQQPSSIPQTPGLLLLHEIPPPRTNMQQV